MFMKLRGQIAFSIFALLLGSQWLVAQGPTYKPGEYPAPRYPQLKSSYTLQDLMPIARGLVRSPYQNYHMAGYAIQPGHKVLIVVPGRIDHLVPEAIVQAIREMGGQADLVYTYGSLLPPGQLPIQNAAREAHSIIGRSGEPPTGFARPTVLRLAETGGSGE